MTEPIPSQCRTLLDARAILRLGLPLLVGNLSVAGMMLADTLMSGRLGAGALAAVAVGASYYSVFMILGLGAMTALSPLVAHAYGAGRNELVGTYAGQGAWIGAVLAVLLIAGLAAVRPVLAWVGTDAAVVPQAVGYVYAVAAGVPGMIGYHALRAISEGLGRTRPVMVIGLLGLSTNVLGNWLFMYGKCGLPALGAVGTGVATAIVQWVMCAAMLLHVARHAAYRPYGILRPPGRPQRDRLLEILRLGLPIGGSMIAENALFSAAALMVSTLGATVALAKF